jgi:hypothetical protein
MTRYSECTRNGQHAGVAFRLPPLPTLQTKSQEIPWLKGQQRARGRYSGLGTKYIRLVRFSIYEAVQQAVDRLVQFLLIFHYLRDAVGKLCQYDSRCRGSWHHPRSFDAIQAPKRCTRKIFNLRDLAHRPSRVLSRHGNRLSYL